MSLPVAVNSDGVSVASDDVAVKSKGADAGVAQVTATVEQVRQLVQLELDRTMEERQEREKRKCNVECLRDQGGWQTGQGENSEAFQGHEDRSSFCRPFFQGGQKEGGR